MDSTISFDGKTQFPITTAETVGHLSQLVVQSVEQKQALFPLGGRTMLDLGQIPSCSGVGIDLRKLDQVIDYPARDMTITVQAGITIERLTSILAAEKQYLPIDIPRPNLATLGGAIAANASGTRRFGCGTLRDYIIGISVINDQGQEIKAGGRVVKNVAGYDLMKLYTGSLGTLGITSQVTLKVKPIPEAFEWHVLPVQLKHVDEVVEKLSRTRTRPVAIDLFNLGGQRASWWPATSTEAQFVIGYEDNAQAVAWQAQQLRQELPAALRENLNTLSNDEATSLLSSIRDFQLWSGGEVSFKANLLPSKVEYFLQTAEALTTKPALQIHVGNGIVHGHFAKGLSGVQVKGFLEKLSRVCAESEGNLIVTRCPPSMKSVLPLWGRSTGDRKMMRIVKEKLDPRGLFNPGRFVDGI